MVRAVDLFNTLAMKAKTLKTIRKYWDYRFCNGKLIMKRKADGEVIVYKSIQEFLSYYIYENIGIGTGGAWHARKRAIVHKRIWEKPCCDKDS